MKTLGIDLSSQKKDTAACVITWGPSGAVVDSPFCRCSDNDLDSLISKSDCVGIDAPFGWPVDFVASVSNWNHETWTNETRDSLRFRVTDRTTRLVTGRWPLSVSSDLIALPAMRAMALLKRHGVTNKSGGENGFYEVYPAASLHRWSLYIAGYKKDLSKRLLILAGMRNKFPELQVSDDHAHTDHNLDALVASITAHTAKTGKTTQPNPDQKAMARSEGWIHIPLE